jgi:hypothetical protein
MLEAIPEFSANAKRSTMRKESRITSIAKTLALRLVEGLTLSDAPLIASVNPLLNVIEELPRDVEILSRRFCAGITGRNTMRGPFNHNPCRY